MNIVERLRGFPSSFDRLEAADLIEQKAARIAELEADRKALGDLLLRSDAQLVALRRKIDEATVVAHISHNGKVFSNGFVYETDKPLISKEDLK